MQKSEEKFFYHVDVMNQKAKEDEASKNETKAEAIAIAALVPALVIKGIMEGNQKFDQPVVTSCIGTCAAVGCTGLAVSIYFGGKKWYHMIKRKLIMKKLTKEEED